MQEPLLAGALENEYPGPVTVVGTVDALRHPVQHQFLQLGPLAELAQTGQQLEVDTDLLLEHVGLEYVDAPRIVGGQQFGDEDVVGGIPAHVDVDRDAAGGRQVARAFLAVVYAESIPNISFKFWR